jgi:hypothetical protein
MEFRNFGRCGAVVAAAALFGCSGGGSGGGGRSTLDVSLMDAPVDGVTEVRVKIDAIWLKPQGGPAVELPMTSPTMTLDLVSLGETNAAILVDDAPIEPGTYEWLAMDVDAEHDADYSDSYVVRTDGGTEELRVPSGRVRLVSGFDVPANQGVRLLFDWDLRQGLVHPPGLAGYLLKPAFRVLDLTAYGALSGSVASATITAAGCDADGAGEGNVVYVYEGTGVTADDIDAADAEPIATAEVAPDGSGQNTYRVVLAPGAYTVAFTCIAVQDEPETSEDLKFTAPQDVTIAAGDTATADF